MVRLRRSALYLPCSNSRAIAKSRELDCDVVLFDLEDAVAPEAKAEARARVREALMERRSLTQSSNVETRAGGRDQELVVRINALNSEWYKEDLLAVAEAKPDGLLLPKVESAEQIRQLARDFANIGGSDDVRFWCMMETPKGILQCDSIAGAHPRLECLVMGTSDLTQDLHALHTSLRLPMLTSLGLCLLAARAHGLSILDGVALDLADDSAFADSCSQGRELGFDGKTLIHPKQIAVCNSTFSPSAAEVERARGVVDAFAAARSGGRGVVVHQGRLVEELHVREAERILATHLSLSTS